MFDGPDTQRFLGRREWVRRIPAILQDPPGTKSRGYELLVGGGKGLYRGGGAGK